MNDEFDDQWMVDDLIIGYMHISICAYMSVTSVIYLFACKFNEYRSSVCIYLSVCIRTCTINIVYVLNKLLTQKVCVTIYKHHAFIMQD